MNSEFLKGFLFFNKYIYDVYTDFNFWLMDEGYDADTIIRVQNEGH